MIIEKNGKEYVIRECNDKWVVSSSKDNLFLSFDVSKKMCQTEEELAEYVINTELF